MNVTKAANELQAIRDGVARGDDAGNLMKRCDAVGAWLASQKWSKKVDVLAKEAHDIATKLEGLQLPEGEWIVKSR